MKYFITGCCTHSASLLFFTPAPNICISPPSRISPPEQANQYKVPDLQTQPAAFAALLVKFSQNKGFESRNQCGISTYIS